METSGAVGETRLGGPGPGAGCQHGRVPIEPPSSPWAFPAVNPGAGDLVAMGADLAAGTILAAYRRGLFPMGGDLPPVAGSRAGTGPTDQPMAWWSPDPRGVLPVAGLRVTRSMRQSARHFDVRVDTAFTEVLAGCADPGRVGGWIDDPIAAAYTELHHLGWAHSVETWRDGQLVGGLYGVAIGGLFAGESMFSRVRDASKVALMGLVDLLDDTYAGQRLLDTQWQTPHLASLGVVEIPRAQYLHRLQAALRLPLPTVFDR